MDSIIFHMKDLFLRSRTKKISLNIYLRRTYRKLGRDSTALLYVNTALCYLANTDGNTARVQLTEEFQIALKK